MEDDEEATHFIGVDYALSVGGSTALLVFERKGDALTFKAWWLDGGGADSFERAREVAEEEE